MGRKAEVSLYRLFNIEGTHRYARIVKSGRGWAPKTQPVGKPGSFYLRYTRDGRRTLRFHSQSLDGGPTSTTTARL